MEATCPADLAVAIEEEGLEAFEAQDTNPLSHQKLLKSFARKFAGRGVEFDDLVAAGQFGLIRAAALYDPGLRVRFSTYAGYWILQGMRRAIRDQGRLIRIPAYIHDALNKGESPDDPTLKKGRRACLRAALFAQSCATVRGGDLVGTTLADLIVDPTGPAAEEFDTLAKALEALQALPPREALVLKMRCGLEGHRPATLQAIAETLGLTRERIRQIEQRALERLRTALTSPIKIQRTRARRVRRTRKSNTPTATHTRTTPERPHAPAYPPAAPDRPDAGLSASPTAGPDPGPSDADADAPS